MHEPADLRRLRGSHGHRLAQWEFGSLDQHFTLEREFFTNPDAEAQALIDAFNTNAKSGYKEIYEVIQ